MQILPASSVPTPPLSAMQTTGASASFTHMPMETWTQRLDSPTGQKFLQAIAQKTGISETDLTSELQGGTTLQSILQSKGVSFADVRQAALGQPGQVQFSGHHHRHGGHGGAGSVDSAILGAIAGKLNMQPGDLQQQLEGGKSLAQLASEGGLSEQDLGAVVEDAVQSLLGYSSNGAAPGALQVPATQVNETV